MIGNCDCTATCAACGWRGLWHDLPITLVQHEDEWGDDQVETCPQCGSFNLVLEWTGYVHDDHDEFRYKDDWDEVEWEDTD